MIARGAVTAGLIYFILLSSISENLFIMQLQTSRQYYEVFKVIES